MTTIILTHGIPGSGKTHWATKYACEHAIKRLNRDELREHIAGRRYHDHKPSPKVEGKVGHQIRQTIRECLAAGEDVLVDEVNLSTKSVQRYYQLASEYNANVEHVYFDVPVEEALRNNNARSRNVPERVIRRLAEKAYAYDECHLKRFAYSPANGTVSYLRDPSHPQEQALMAYNEALLLPSTDVVIFDMDGTLADMRMASDKFMSTDRNFHAFHQASLRAPWNDDVAQLAFESAEHGFSIIVVTARSADYFEVTKQWLSNFEIPVSRLYMRAREDFRPDYEVKSDILAELEGQGMRVLFAVDDNPKVIRLWEEHQKNVVRVPFHTPRDNGPHDYSLIEVPSIFGAGFCVHCNTPTDQPALCESCTTW